jgi:hypothetical protein
MKRLAILVLIAMSGSSAAYTAEPVELATFRALARPAPTLVLQYGTAASQAVDLFLPTTGNGPHPVAILIHGGCWSVTTDGRQQLRHLGAELASQGIAVWSIGYRRANEDGGGYPGTFQDIALAIDRLRSDAARYDLSRARSSSDIPPADMAGVKSVCLAGMRRNSHPDVVRPLGGPATQPWGRRMSPPCADHAVRRRYGSVTLPAAATKNRSADTAVMYSLINLLVERQRVAATHQFDLAN